MSYVSHAPVLEALHRDNHSAQPDAVIHLHEATTPDLGAFLARVIRVAAGAQLRLADRLDRGADARTPRRPALASR